MNDEVIQWFWKCVRSWPPERKSRLLQFATGTSRIPVNGFKDLQGSDGPRRFTIEKSGDPSQLPKSHTCFNRIDLPPYKDYASLEHKLTLAVECVLWFHNQNSVSLTHHRIGKRSVLVRNSALSQFLDIFQLFFEFYILCQFSRFRPFCNHDLKISESVSSNSPLPA